MYQTGSATDLADLMSQFRTFLTGSAGYTESAFSADGTGHRLHVHKGSRYFNFRSFVNENVSANGAASQYGIYMNAGTGYNGANPWHNQPGVFIYNSGANYYIAGMNKLDSAIVSYHLFYFNNADADVVYFIVESPAGTYNRLLFGRVGTANIGTHWASAPNGMFYNGSVFHTSSNYSLATTFFGGPVNFWGTTQPAGALYGTVDGATEWMSGNFLIPQSQMSPARPQVFDSIMKTSTFWLCSPNTFNSMPPLVPIIVNVTRATSDISATTPWSPAGELPDIHWINLANINPGSVISIASDTYKVFPFRKKSSTWTNADVNNGTYRMGFAIKTN